MTQRAEVYDCLPATPVEIAAALGITPRTANAVLWGLRRLGEATPTDMRVRSDRPGVGRKMSRIWIPVGVVDIDVADDDNNETGVTGSDICRMNIGRILRNYRHVRARTDEIKRRQMHAFTHMGLKDA